MKLFGSKTLFMLISLFFFGVANAGEPAESVCFGTPEKGRIEQAWQLPVSGGNYQAYSSAGDLLGRNYAHSAVYGVILDAYKELQTTMPMKKYVYGETGWKKGGRLRPHKTHQNGLSVDFFVPVVNEKWESVSLPTGAFNKYGYAIEFSQDGRYENYSIDFEAMAAHLFALKRAADIRGIGIKWVIFDNDLQKLLFQASKGKELQAKLVFSRKKPWVRHDEHYHVDFIVSCKDYPN